MGDMFCNQGGISNQGGVTESSYVCMQYSDFKVLKSCLAFWIFGKVSSQDSEFILSLVLPSPQKCLNPTQ